MTSSTTALIALKKLEAEKLDRTVAGLDYMTLEAQARWIDTVTALPMLEGIARLLIAGRATEAAELARRWNERGKETGNSPSASK